MGLIQEIPTDEVRMGMRVEAVWVPDDELGPTLASVKYFRPTASPTPTTRPTRNTCEPPTPARGTGRWRSSPSPRLTTSAARVARNEVEMLLPVIGEVFANVGITKDDVGFICSARPTTSSAARSAS